MMTKQDYQRRVHLLKKYLRYGSVPGRDYFRLYRDRKGRGIYIMDRQAMSYIAVIDPSAVRILRKTMYRSTLESFAKTQNRRTIILDRIKEQRNMRDCRGTNWYVKNYNKENKTTARPESRPQVRPSVIEFDPRFVQQEYYTTANGSRFGSLNWTEATTMSTGSLNEILPIRADALDEI